MKIEVWKTYPEFPFIQGSNLGRVRTLDRYVKTKNGLRHYKGHVLPQQHEKGGYMRVNFNVNGKKFHRFAHRIVASCFLKNPDNLPQVNHKDCNPANNRVENLEWCSASYNSQYREKFGVSMMEAQGYPLFTINLKTKEVLWFKAQMEAERQLGVYHGNINAVLKGKRKTAGGYFFTNADDKAVELTKNKFGREVADNVWRLMEEKQYQ